MDAVLAGDWHPLARGDEVVEGQPWPSQVLGEELVLWRHEGVCQVWRDLCLHRGTRLSLGKVRADRLVCPYHGWEYARGGRCVHMPAHPDQPPPERACIPQFEAREESGLVWGCLGEPRSELPDWCPDDCRQIVCGPYPFQASAPRVVENFLDVTHFPFVHGGLLGDEQHPEVSDYRVETGPTGLTLHDLEVYQPDPDGTGRGSRVRYTYRVYRPLLASLSKQVGESGVFAILLAVCPVDERNSVAYMVIGMNYGLEIPEAELRAFQDRIVAQDLPIVESQRPERLPLDLAAELHLRSDRAALAYRRWLRDLGLGFGTA